MGTTPIYGFPYPDPSDLVANYPAMGQQLAEDIEDVLPTIGGLAPVAPTTIANSGGTATLSGNTVSFSGVTSLTLNGIFSATYDNYRIVVLVTPTAAGNFGGRLTSSGTPHTGATSYTRQRITGDSSSVGANRSNDNYFYWIAEGTTYPNMATVDMGNPFAAVRTSFIGLSQSVENGGYLHFSVGQHDQATSYDGIQFTQLASGTATGSVAVYGYKK